MLITNKELSGLLKRMNSIIEIYKETHEEKERDYKTYEEKLMSRIKTASRNLVPLIREACESVKTSKRGKPPSLSIEKKTNILLLKHLFDLSNRNMAYMLCFFSALTDVETSSKTVERIYSNPYVKMTLHNLFMLLLKKKGIKKVNASGDGTGYSLLISQHYNSNPKKKYSKKRKYRFSFAIIDLDTGMYVAFGTSMKSEKDAFNKAIKLLKETGIEIESMRLDKYYSHSGTLDIFNENTKIYLIPKKNATIKGTYRWKRMLREILDDVFSYLKEYYKRNNSESGISADKRLCGQIVHQKREDRIETAISCTNLWHNIMRLG